VLQHQVVHMKPGQIDMQTIVDDNIQIDLPDLPEAKEDELDLQEPALETSMFASVLPSQHSLYFRNLRDLDNKSVFSIRNGKVCTYTHPHKTWRQL